MITLHFVGLKTRFCPRRAAHFGAAHTTGGTPMSHNTQKKIAVINDFSGFGRCSIAVSLPIISALGIQCCPLPTAIFSNHTGFSSYFWTDFTPHMAEYADEWRKLDLRFDAITSGFLGSLRQIELVKDFFRRFKTPGTLTVVDPVMGDNGALYKTYTPEMAAGMRELVREADILTPNLTEACSPVSPIPRTARRWIWRACAAPSLTLAPAGWSSPGWSWGIPWATSCSSAARPPN